MSSIALERNQFHLCSFAAEKEGDSWVDHTRAWLIYVLLDIWDSSSSSQCHIIVVSEQKWPNLLRQLTTNNFLFQKIYRQYNCGSDKGQGRTPLYIFHVSGKYFQSFIFPALPTTLTTTSEAGGEEQSLYIYKQETKGFSALHFFLVLYRFYITYWL